MSDEKVVLFADYKKSVKSFENKYGDNIAICQYKKGSKNDYVVFQFCYSNGDIVAVQCYPSKDVETVDKILFRTGLAVDNADRLIKLKEGKDA